MSSTSFWTCPSSTRNRLRKKGAISDIVEEKWVVRLLHLIHDGDVEVVGVVEVVEELGLITCGKIVYRHGAIVLIVRECSGFNPRR